MYAENPDHVLGVCKRTEDDEDPDCSTPRLPYNDYSLGLKAVYKEPFIYLPHSCDFWVIGGAREARLLIAHLEAAIAELEEPK